jgi:hypothetical protein
MLSPPVAALPMPRIPFSVCSTTPASGAVSEQGGLADAEVDVGACRNVAGNDRSQFIALQRSAIQVLDRRGSITELNVLILVDGGCSVMGSSLPHSAPDEFVAPGRSKLVTL